LCRSRDTCLTRHQRRRTRFGRRRVGCRRWARGVLDRGRFCVSAGDHEVPDPLRSCITRSSARGSGRGSHARWRDGGSGGLEDLIGSITHLERLLATRLDALFTSDAIDLFIGLQCLQAHRLSAARAGRRRSYADQRHRERTQWPAAFRRNCRPEGGGEWRLHAGLPRPRSFRGPAAPRRGTF
jgi:hypothetical protein